MPGRTSSFGWPASQPTPASRSGRLDRELLENAERIRRVREGADYDARVVAHDEAEALLAQAERFVAAIASLLG